MNFTKTQPALEKKGGGRVPTGKSREKVNQENMEETGGKKGGRELGNWERETSHADDR